MNKPINYYQRGKYSENVVRKELEAMGYFVVRASLSRGPADLVALRAGVTPLLVQVKRSHLGLRPAERHALTDAATQSGGRAVLALYERYQPIRWFQYVGTRANDRVPFHP